MKPTLTLDERGLILHVTTEAGEGVAVPLKPETFAEAYKGVERVLSPEGKRRLLRGVVQLVLELTKPHEPDAEETNGKKV